jgi:hypothetical protein
MKDTPSRDECEHVGRLATRARGVSYFTSVNLRDVTRPGALARDQ